MVQGLVPKLAVRLYFDIWLSGLQPVWPSNRYILRYVLVDSLASQPNVNVQMPLLQSACTKFEIWLAGSREPQLGYLLRIRVVLV